MQVVFTSIRSTQVYYVQTNDSKKYLDQQEDLATIFSMKAQTVAGTNEVCGPMNIRKVVFSFSM